jgi:hypothetical protein
MDCAAVTWGEWIRTVVASLGPVLVVIGWFLVNRQNNQREDRKELRQLVDRAINSINDAVDLTIKFHGNQPEDRDVHRMDSWRLLLAFLQIADQMNLLAEKGMNIEPCSKAYNALKFAATGHDFMTKKWKPWAKDDKRWMELTDAARTLCHGLDLKYVDSKKEVMLPKVRPVLRSVEHGNFSEYEVPANKADYRSRAAQLGASVRCVIAFA